MSFQSWAASVKSGNKIVGGALILALLMGGIFSTQGGKNLLANVVGYDASTIETSGVPIKGVYKPYERFLTANGNGLAIQKMVAVGTGDFQDADTAETAVVENGEEVKYLIHVGNVNTTEEVDSAGNRYWPAAFVTVQDQFPTDLVGLNREVTCWFSEDANDTGADLDSRRVAIVHECSYSEMSQRFFNAGTNIRPDTFMVGAFGYLHILVTGNYVQTPTLLGHASDVKCNIAIADGGSAFGIVQDSACVRVDSVVRIPDVIRTPRPDPSRPKPIPEPEFLENFELEGNLK